MPPSAALTLALVGDVMTGRGIDQVLSHPGEPILYEPVVNDARFYVELAERANGAIPRPVDSGYIWGDALGELRRPETDLRIVNLETSVTASGTPWPDKGIHYRMHPGNVSILTAANIDCCCLANNHILDWGYPGLAETLQTLDGVGLAHTGAGADLTDASAPAIVEVKGKRRVLVYSLGSTSSGIPKEWGASAARPGINLLPDLSAATAQNVIEMIEHIKRPSDVVVASIHWGENWGYGVPVEQIAFAHRLVEGGVTIVHGHSSHHPKALEVYQDGLILYGCGDFITDYEGIGGYEEFRPDLTVLYLVTVDPVAGRVLHARLVPYRMRRFRLERVGAAEASWLRDRLNSSGATMHTRVELETDTSMTLQR